MKLQRTGLTEGSLLYNNWLKTKNLYRADTEAEFINWLYSTSGWYDRDIKGSHFDIDVEAVKRSEVYQRFLQEFQDSLRNSDMIHLMLHSSWHLNGLRYQSEYVAQFIENPYLNYCYWKDMQRLHSLLEGKKVLVVSSIAPLITQKWGGIPYQSPQTHLNRGDDKNAFETLERMYQELPKDFDIAVVSCGAYGCLLVDKIVKSGKDALTIGSGIYDLFPVKDIPDKYKPKDFKKVEDGRYWNF